MMVGCDCITSVLICAYNSRWYNSYITTSFNENVIGPSFSILFPLISSLFSLLHLFCVLSLNRGPNNKNEVILTSILCYSAHSLSLVLVHCTHRSIPTKPLTLQISRSYTHKFHR
jgi:hypothetical protein